MVATASVPPPAGDVAARTTRSTTYHLCKFLFEIGAEIDTTTSTPDGGVERKAAFSFRDRTTTVPLASTYVFDRAGGLLHFASWGKTSRMSDVDARVDARSDGSFAIEQLGRAPARVTPVGPFAAVSAYAPALGQAVLLETWLARGRPSKIAVLPEGTATIESRGAETFDAERGEKVMLEHVAISGLVWGREDAWVDDHGQLAAIVTRDAEFDHFEVARDGFVSILPALAKRSGADGAAWLAAAAKGAERPTPPFFALVGAELIDGTGKAPIKDAVVLVRDGKIVAAGPRASTPIPSGAATVDVTGKTIVPGLWDMHAHVEQVEQGAAYLAAGVTTVRDLGNILDFITGIRDAIDAGAGLGPRVLVDGIVDGEGDAALGTVRIKKPEDVAPVLDRLKRAGCLEVKIYSSIAPALVPAIARAAHERGMRVTGHVPTGMNAQEALDAGFDAINHIAYLALLDATDEERRGWSRAERFRRIASMDLQSPRMKKLYATLLAKKAYVDDTMALYDLLMHTDAENSKNEPGIAKLPRELAGMVGGVAPDGAAAAGAAFDKYIELLRELHKRGIPTVAGTDISVPGFSIHRELEIYVQAGFTPMEAIEAATSIPARLMHLDKEAGTIEAGRRADLIVVDGDPLADIHALRNVVTTIAQGKSYDPAALARLVGFTP
jgi:imidazolonepropionase-like amidohydrolase